MRVIAKTTEQDVFARETCEDIVTSPTREQVVAHSARDRVVAIATQNVLNIHERVCSGCACCEVYIDGNRVHGRIVDVIGIRACAAIHGVGAFACHKNVVAGKAV